MIGPHQSIILALTSTGQGAAAWMADFRDEFRDYTAEVEAYPNEIYTNGLWDVVYVVKNRRTGRVESTFATHQFDPNTKSKQLSGGLGR